MNYFRPWRRKIGVLTLLLACAFMAGWVRSRDFYEYIAFPIGRHATVLMAAIDNSFSFAIEIDGAFIASVETCSVPTSEYKATFDFPNNVEPLEEDVIKARKRSTISRRFRTEYYPALGDDYFLRLVRMKYYYIVPSLAALSAYLLSRPRVIVKQPMNAESHSQ